MSTKHIKIGEFGVFGENGKELEAGRAFGIPDDASAPFAVDLVQSRRAKFVDAKEAKAINDAADKAAAGGEPK